ncbi:MAG: NfeD family protein [Bacteroidota bacterium]|nr:NfeD family protein [Bacteroidota bacterium]
MTITVIVLLILAGLILVLLEILVVPGIGVVGILGGIMIIFAIIGGYNRSPVHGHITLAASFLLSIILIYLSIKTKTWKKMSLNNEIDGRVNTRVENSVNEGDIGLTISRLNPMGKALINDNLYEVESKVGYIPENKEIIVLKATPNKIIVKLKQLN